MSGLNELEKAALDKLLAGDHPVLSVLRAQSEVAELASREYTGVGFYVSFEVPADAPVLASRQDFELGDVHALVDGLLHGAGFVLFIRDGRLDFLEGYSYDEPWPEEVRGFKLSYQHEPRELGIPALVDGSSSR